MAEMIKFRVGIGAQLNAKDIENQLLVFEKLLKRKPNINYLSLSNILYSVSVDFL